MSKLDELIQELSPEGVEYMQLGAIEDGGLIKLGRGNVISKKDIAAEPGDYPIYSSSASGVGEFGRYGKYMFDDERLSWSVDGGGRFFYRHPHKYSVTNVSGWLKVLDSSRIDIKYLFYALDSAWSTKKFDYTKKAHPSVIRNEYKIPLPPLEVQKEIASILDKFTQLEAELSLELDARRAQYEYYRNELYGVDFHKHLNLIVKPEVSNMTFSELGTITRGRRFVKDDIMEAGAPCIHYGEMYTHYSISAIETRSFISHELASKLRKAKTGNVVIVAAGETVEDIGNGVAWLGESDVVIHDACFIFEHNLDPKYVSHFLRTSDFHKQIKRSISTGKISSISSKGLEKAVIPVPPVDVQEQIVSILDKFESLINDLSIGLPAEIEARHKQYKYYRTKLLTFQELPA